jgi:outer membrane protein assembly factor BamB
MKVSYAMVWNGLVADMIDGVVRWAHGTPAGGIAVSDGVQWTHTDLAGRFWLTATTRPVWICRPAEASCDRWWQHLDGARQAEFVLIRRSRPITAIAHLSDTHVSVLDGDRGEAVELANRFGDGTDCAHGLSQALTAAYRAGAELAVVTGDLTDHGTRAEFEMFERVVAAAPIPVETIPGNHDHYGHRHAPDGRDHPAGGGFLGAATTWRYEQGRGPRWWAADIGGFHLLALDWFSYQCDIDRAHQRAFIRTDLASRHPARPVIVLSHDVPADELLELIALYAGPSTGVTVLSGHWHASVDRECNGVRYIAAPPTSFGGLDWSPPGWHLLTANHSRHLQRSIQSTCPGGDSTPPARTALWSAPAGHSQHGANLVRLDDQHLAVPTTRGSRGHLTIIDTGTGRATTSVALDGDAITSLTRAANGCVLAQTLSGTLSCIDPTSGALRWQYAMPRPTHQRLRNPPILTNDGTIVAGTLDHLVALSVDTGQPLWATTELGPVDTLMTYGQGLHHGDQVVIPFGGPYRGLTALDARDGSVIWTQTTSAVPSSSLTPIPGTDDALLVRTGAQLLERIDLISGAAVWTADVPGGFTTTSPIHTSTAVALITGDGRVHRLDPATGVPIADPTRAADNGAGWAPYRSGGPGIAATPLLTPNGIVVSTVTGAVWILDPTTPRQELVSAPFGQVTTAPAQTGNNQLAILTTDAQLHIIALPAEPIPAPVAATQGIHQ